MIFYRTDETKEEIACLLELMKENKDGEVKDVAARIASLMDKQTTENNSKTPIEIGSDTPVKVKKSINLMTFIPDKPRNNFINRKLWTSSLEVPPSPKRNTNG